MLVYEVSVDGSIKIKSIEMIPFCLIRWGLHRKGALLTKLDAHLDDYKVSFAFKFTPGSSEFARSYYSFSAC